MSRSVDQLNIGLIFLSLFMAFLFPFELFLFSYAVFGPMHYLTEIHWLREKNYFVQQKKAVWAYVIIAVLGSLPMFLNLPLFSDCYQRLKHQNLSYWMGIYYSYIVFSALFFAIGLLLFKSIKKLTLFFLLGILIGYFLIHQVPVSVVVLTIFVPTIIHVYLFTLLFMVFGYQKQKTSESLIAIIIMLLIPVLIFSSQIIPGHYLLSTKTIEAFKGSGIYLLVSEISKMVGIPKDSSFSYVSASSIKIQIFIAFAYTYHYLNWFSKTTVIGWTKNLSKRKVYAILATWLAVVILYRVNYKMAVVFLFFLSYLHVMLEFPLNVITIKSIFRPVAR